MGKDWEGIQEGKGGKPLGKRGREAFSVSLARYLGIFDAGSNTDDTLLSVLIWSGSQTLASGDNNAIFGDFCVSSSFQKR